MARALGLFLAALATLCAPSGAGAQDLELRPRWQPEWTRFGLTHLGISAVSGGLAVGLRLGLPAPRQGWKESVLFDDLFRDALRADDPSLRQTWSDLSDGLEIGFLLYPVVIDAGLVAGLGYRDPELAAELALISVEAFLVSSVFVGLSKSLVGRVRPDGVPCDAAGEDFACRSETTRRSFVSGHAASSFTSAGIICAHHLNVPLYGGGWPDGLACGGAIGLAGFNGLLRVASDRHYATDVLAGAIVGFSVGFLVPTLLHYSGFELFGPEWGLVPATGARGLALAGGF